MIYKLLFLLTLTDPICIGAVLKADNQLELHTLAASDIQVDGHPICQPTALLKAFSSCGAHPLCVLLCRQGCAGPPFDSSARQMKGSAMKLSNQASFHYKKGGILEALNCSSQQSVPVKPVSASAEFCLFRP